MKRIFTIVKNTLLYTILFIIIGSALSIFTIWYYQDFLKQNMVRQLNTFINTPIKVETINLEIFEYFPLVALNLENVIVTESTPSSKLNLTTMKTVYIAFNPLQLIRGNYIVYSLKLEEGSIFLRNDKVHGINYEILKKNETSQKTSSFFEIANAELTNVNISMDDQKNNYGFDISIPSLNAKINFLDSLIGIQLNGASKINDLQINKKSYLKSRQTDLRANLTYNSSSSVLMIRESNFLVNNSNFEANGTIDINNSSLNLLLDGKETDFKSLVALLPKPYSDRFAKYSSEGSVYFDMEIKGSISDKSTPSISSHFGFKNATIYKPETKISLSNSSFEGWFATTSLNNLQNAELQINDFSGVFDGEQIKGSFSMENFDDPLIRCEIEGLFHLSSLSDFFSFDGFENISGDLITDFSLEGKTKDFKDLSRMSKIKSAGQVEVIDIGFLPSKYGLLFSNWNGTLLFNSNSIAFNDLAGKIGDSEIFSQGRVVNIFTYLFSKDESTLIIDSKVSSPKLDLDQILRHENKSKNSDYSFSIANGLKTRFEIDIDKLLYKRISAENITGIALVDNQILELKNVQFDEIGGKISLDASINTSGKNIELLSTFKTRDIYIDSLFYVFNNFNQSFLVKEHMKGRITSEVNTELSLTNKLEFIPKTLLADMQIKITGGQLIKFEPIYVLEDYVPRNSLENLRFSDLTNTIHVENETVYIPEMEIHSNAASIKIGGKHTFDERINYKIVAPLIITTKVDPDTAFGAIEDDGTKPPKIHLILKGTTDDYSVSLDKERIKNEAISNLKDEVKELKEAFQQKREEKKKKVSLDEDDYFDWDN